MPTPTNSAVTNALLDLSRAAGLLHVDWALIGGQALIAYGVPRETLDADALIGANQLEAMAHTLVDTFGWTPLEYDARSGDYVEAEEPTIHFMDDPVLFDVGEERRMIPLGTPLDLPVELLAAQHPVEQDMIDGALVLTREGVRIPVAPLGGVLLVKAKADRTKDRAAIEQASEHLKKSTIVEALAWADARDPGTTEDLRSLVEFARQRRAPKKTTRSKGKGRSR